MKPAIHPGLAGNGQNFPLSGNSQGRGCQRETPKDSSGGQQMMEIQCLIKTQKEQEAIHEIADALGLMSESEVVLASLNITHAIVQEITDSKSRVEERRPQPGS